MIEYPKLNSNDSFSNKLLTNGHSHFILLDKNEKIRVWGDEVKFKLQLAERLASGRKGFNYKCKIVGIILGNIPCEDEILTFIDKNLPLILIEDSQLSANIKDLRNRQEITDSNDSKIVFKLELKKISQYSKIIEIDDDSENLASATHLCLTITL